MTSATPNSATASKSYRWLAPGDVNAFFGLMLDNISVMILMASLLVGAYGFPAEFVLAKMIPGTALGVLVGDLIYTAMAFRLAKKQGRSNVTSMPLGLDTPSTFGTVFLILGPAFKLATERGLDAESAARHAWFVGVSMIFASGVFKLACAPFCSAVRKLVPRAGLLGSLTAIALVIISFMPFLDIAAEPIAGMVSLAIVLAALTARWKLPRGLPGMLGAVIAGCAVLAVVLLVQWLLNQAGYGPFPINWSEGRRPDYVVRFGLPTPLVDWWIWFATNSREALVYLPVALPLALATVVGGIDCAESAAAAGDDYSTGQIIASEGIATLAGGLFGGVIQSTPYIGHPAYKAMGARAGYTLATALFVGGAGVLGYFAWIYFLIPKPVVFPILIFVGLEITAQSFKATERRHFPALALACVPALAYLAYVHLGPLLAETGKDFASLSEVTQRKLQTITILAQGFVVTSLLWGTALARLIDGQIRAAAGTLALAGVFAAFGVIHSPLASGPILPPWQVVRELEREDRLRATLAQTPYHWAAAYGAASVALLLLGKFGARPEPDEVERPLAI